MTDQQLYVPQYILDAVAESVLEPTSFAFGPNLTDAQMAERAAREAARRAEREQRWQSARALATELLAGICDLHRPDDGGDCLTCGGDDFWVAWPCETYRLVERAVTA